MFIKKDLRKIPKILGDAIVCEDSVNDDDETVAVEHRDKRSKVQKPLTELRLGRRQQEFQGSIQILSQPKYIPKLQHLQKINLYDCALTNLDGVGLFGQCPQLAILNLGRNPLQSLPDELADLSKSLRELWLDDCQLSGALPNCITQLSQLQLLRVPHNQLASIPDSIAKLKQLKVLCLDRNPLDPGHLPDMSSMRSLQELHVRHTQLAQLPGLPASLQVLHVSSNPLTELWPDTDLTPCPALTHLYINGCQLVSLPDGLLAEHTHLKRIVMSHNPQLRRVSSDLRCALEASESSSFSVDIVWQPNPQLLQQDEEDIPGRETDSMELDDPQLDTQVHGAVGLRVGNNASPRAE
eukprot:Nitzschia sp. Nitz4//scaffold302_size22357//535//1593//NITZ4_008558-RA/size22357-processed-gene-0.10-mRNA-1//-1//CDS//3329547029//1637//frame0